MKYKVGDEVLVKGKIKEVYDSGVIIAFGKAYFALEHIDVEKTYSDGLNDAWELAKKIVMGVEDGGFDSQEVIDVFGKNRYYSFKDFTAEEALAKIEAYEKKESVCVGDVVECNGFKGVVLHFFHNGSLNIVYENGIIETLTSAQECKKTGKHIDIKSLLRQIGE